MTVLFTLAVGAAVGEGNSSVLGFHNRQAFMSRPPGPADTSALVGLGAVMSCVIMRQMMLLAALNTLALTSEDDTSAHNMVKPPENQMDEAVSSTPQQQR